MPKQVLTICILLGLLPTCASALNLHFYPMSISAQAKPGQVINRTFSLTVTPDSTAARFKVRVEDWWRSADNSKTFYAPAGTLSRSCGLWCSVNPVESSLEPGKTLTVKVSIRVPHDVQPGGYWAALTVDQVPDPLTSRPEGVGMAFKGSVSVGIFVEVPTITKSAKITGVKVTGDRVKVTLRNDGNTPLKVSPTFEFYSPGQDKAVASVKLGAEALLTDDYSTCEYSAALPTQKDLPRRRYKVRVIVDAGLEYLMGAENELDIIRADSSGSGK